MRRAAFLLIGCWWVAQLWAMNYTVAFYRSAIDTTELSGERLNSTYNCVVGERNAQKIAKAPEGLGIKGGTASVGGYVALQLDTIYHITQLTVYACSYSHKSDTASTKGIAICGQTCLWEKNYRTTIRPYTISIDCSTDTITLSSLMDSYNRWYVQRLEFTADDPRPAAPKLTSPLSLDLGSAILVDKQPATDTYDLTLEAQSTIDSLELSFAEGAYFSLGSSTLPPLGGTTTLSYTVSSATDKGFVISDSLIIVAKGTNQTLRRAAYVKLFARNYDTPVFPVDSSCMRIGPMPGNYYQPAQGLKDSALKAALSEVIHCGPRYRYGAGHQRSWHGFFFTDRDTATQQVLDMYSHKVRYFDPEDTCASVYQMDIEHMLPKSWWGSEVNEAYCDLYHLVPADYSANRSKSNNAPGIPADSTFNNGSFVTGSGKAYGLTRVFCPEDAYKGDFARAYFYIVTCYDSLQWVKTGDAGKAMTNDSYLEFRPWLQELLMSWHRLDPVSEKEKARAVEVNKIQGNRNPFIDYPELAEYIWGTKQGQQVNFYHLTQSFGDPYSEEPTAEVTIHALPDSSVRKIVCGDEIGVVINGEVYTLLGEKK